MAKAKKNTKTAKYKLNKRLIIVMSVVGVLLLIGAGFWLQSYFVEKQTIADLSAVNKELRIIYDNVLELNKDNVSGSYFRDNCSVSNVNWLEQKKSCGPSGNVILKSAVNLEGAKKILAESIQGSKLGLSANDLNTGQDLIGGSTGTNEKGIKCYVGYSKDNVTDAWSYGFMCRKEVPDFLPGYTIED